MHSIASVRSASGAANYFAKDDFKDNYYTADTPRFEDARARLGGAMLVVDETSMVSSEDMLRLHRVTEALGIDKLILVGDRQQLSSIDAGKSFAMIQAAGGTMARMDENIRQRTDTLRTVAALANVGKAGEAMKVLGDNVHESASAPDTAAEMWLALSAEDREATAMFASGRASRAIINQRIQDGLAAEGTVRGEGVHLTVFERVNLTREELRYPSSYRQGMTLDVGRGGAQDATHPGWPARARRIGQGRRPQDAAGSQAGWQRAGARSARPAG